MSSKTVPVASIPTSATPRRIKQAHAIERAELFLARKLPQHLQKLMELANGVVVLGKEDLEGDSTVYVTPPDRQALQFLIERGMGKATNKMEIAGEGGGPIQVLPWLPPLEQTKIPETTITDTTLEVTDAGKSEAVGSPEGS